MAGFLRHQRHSFSGTLTGFQTAYKDFRGFSRTFGTDTTSTVANSDLDVNGVEFEAEWRPVRWGGINLTGVVQKSKVKITSVTGPSADLYRAEVLTF